jgi:hypothetical protein
VSRAIPALYQQVARLFLAAIPAPQTPEMIAAVSAWELQELGTVPKITANNPWNLHGVKGDYGGLATGDWYAGPGDVHVAVFATLADGVKASVMNLRAHGSDFAKYDKVLAAAKSGDPIAFLDALAASAWSAGRYGTKNGGANTLVAIYRTLALPAPAQAPTTGGSTVPASTKPNVVQTYPVLTGGLITSGVLTAMLQAVTGGLWDPAHPGDSIARILIALAPTIGSLIQQQFVWPSAHVTPNGDGTATPIDATPGTTTGTSPAPPVVVTPAEPVYAVTVDSVIDERAFLGDVKGGTPCWQADGSPHAPVEADGSIVAFTRKVKLSGSLNGTFNQSSQTPPLYYRWQDVAERVPAAPAAPVASVPTLHTGGTSMRTNPGPDSATIAAILGGLGGLTPQAYYEAVNAGIMAGLTPAVQSQIDAVTSGSVAELQTRLVSAEGKLAVARAAAEGKPTTTDQVAALTLLESEVATLTTAITTNQSLALNVQRQQAQLAANPAQLFGNETLVLAQAGLIIPGNGTW